MKRNKYKELSEMAASNPDSNVAKATAEAREENVERTREIAIMTKIVREILFAAQIIVSIQHFHQQMIAAHVQSYLKVLLLLFYKY